jgi:hypothetical protein
MNDRSKRRHHWLHVFGAPIVIAVVTLGGLLAALLLGETGRYLSWFAVALPVVVCAWAWLRVRFAQASPND